VDAAEAMSYDLSFEVVRSNWQGSAGNSALSLYIPDHRALASLR
jgi:hypothetical protein